MFSKDHFLRFYKGFFIEGGYKVVLKGLGNTLSIAFLALIIGMIVGSIIAIIKINPSKSKFNKVIQKVCDGYVALFRGTPIVVQLLLTYYGLFGSLNISAFQTAILIFGLNSSAYVSEIIRGGINSVDIGQTEASRSLGLPFPTTMVRIILPQAIKNTLPTLGNEFISLLKETSVCLFVGVIDLTNAFYTIAFSKIEYFYTFTFLALSYLIIVIGVTFLFKLIERRMKKSDRN
ncbi:MAG: amino acid ABC transporter permease [Clostridia bacterium]|nr:amino acid ABC transporter permease [Clostridia bacterium]